MSITAADLSDGLNVISRVCVRTYDEDFQTLLTKVQSGVCSFDDVAIVFDVAQTEQSGRLPPDGENQEYGTSDLAEGTGGRRNRSWLYYVARSICKYVSNDPELRKMLDDATSAAQKSGHPIASMTTVQTLSMVSIASYIVQAIPGLSELGTAGVAGILLLVLAVGVDAFCSWVKDRFCKDTSL